MPKTLSEADSKNLLSGYSIPFAPEVLAIDADAAGVAAEELGFPVAIKLCGDNIAHKTERGLVRLGIDTTQDAVRSATELFESARREDRATGVLVSPMIRGNREFIAGMNRDAQFGPTVLFGVGGVLTEILDDAVIRLVPLSEADAHEMVSSIAHAALLEEFRGEPEVDRDGLVTVLMGLSQLALDRGDVNSVDINPLIVADGKPVAVDALVELSDGETDANEPGANEPDADQTGADQTGADEMREASL